MLIWLVRILLCIFSADCLVDFKVFAEVERKSFLASPKFYGTKPRYEFEHKFAVELHNGLSIDIQHLGKVLTATLQNLVTSRSLRFDQQVFASYHVSPEFESFVFKDIYLDTPDFAIYKADSAYRLRYRWVRQEKYYRHRLFPFLEVFYPDRCEIQFKGGYKRHKKNATIGVMETRFEFRHESPPFLHQKNAPPAPWLESEFLPVAQSGMYLDYPILPMKELIKMLPSSMKKIHVQPVVNILTERYRTHLNVRNPWGTGPNPEHAFIVAIDVASASGVNTTKFDTKRVMEIEIEIDRNISTEVDRFANMVVKSDTLDFSAKEFSVLARKNLLHDLNRIKERISMTLKNEYKLHPLPVMNKFSRFIKQ